MLSCKGCNHGCGTRPRSAAHACYNEDQTRVCKRSVKRLQIFLSGTSTDFRIRICAKPLRGVNADLYLCRALTRAECFCVRIHSIKFHLMFFPIGCHHPFDDVATGIADPENLKFVSYRLGYLFFSCHSCSPLNFFNAKFLTQKCANLAESRLDGPRRQTEFLCDLVDSPQL